MTAAELPEFVTLPTAPVCGTATAAIERLNTESTARAAARRHQAEEAEGIDFFQGAAPQ